MRAGRGLRARLLGAVVALLLFVGIGAATHQAGATAQGLTVQTNPPTIVEYDRATLDATVISDVRVHVTLVWGATTDYGNVASTADMGGDILGTHFTIQVGGLTPGATYHYRVEVQTASGIVDGGDVAFQTAANHAPVVSSVAAHLSVNDQGFTLCPCAGVTAGIDAGGLPTHVTIEYGLTPALGEVDGLFDFVPDTSTTWPYQPYQYSSGFGGNDSRYDTTYYFRVVATNAVGTGVSGVGTVTTPPPNAGGGSGGGGGTTTTTTTTTTAAPPPPTTTPSATTTTVTSNPAPPGAPPAAGRLTTGKTVRLGARSKSDRCVRGTRPDRRCSPGAYYSALTKPILCSRAFHPSSIAGVSRSRSDAVRREYGTAAYGHGVALDHVVPLELGGSNDIANLFPESTSGRLGSHVKDKLEKRLRSMVCGGQMSLAAARRGIAADWIALYRSVFDVGL